MSLSRRHGFTWIELLTIITVVTVVLSLVAPAVVNSREVARNNQCKNHLKQLGIAFHNYHDTFGRFPPGWTNHHDAPGTGTRYGWSVFLLPYLNQIQIYKQFEFNLQVATPGGPFATPIKNLRCPSDSTADQNPLRGGFGTSNYSGNFGDKAPPRLLMDTLTEYWPGQAATPKQSSGFFGVNSSRGIRNVTDGLSNTFLAGERSVTSGAGIWMGVRGNNYENDQVTDCSFGNEINSGFSAFSSRHPGGSQFLIGDGVVRFVNENIQSSAGTGNAMGIYQRLSHISDGNIISNY